MLVSRFKSDIKSTMFIMYIYIYGCFLKWVPQQLLVFLLKMTILGCEMGVPLFKETPIIYYIYIYRV